MKQKMSLFSIVAVLLVFFAHNSCSQNIEYFWKKYDGTIPPEALEGGSDINGDSIFIGRAKIGEDVIVVPIYSNQSHVLVPSDGTVVKANSDIEIFCGSEIPVDWIRANADNLYVVLIEKNPVHGGKIQNRGYLHVGRIFYENEIKIGPVFSFVLDNALLYFVHEGKVLSTDKYEVLLYNSPRAQRRRPWNRRGPGRGLRN